MTLSILNQLAATSKTTEKLAILEKHKDNSALKATCHFAYNPRIKYWIKKRPPELGEAGESFSLLECLGLLEQEIASRNLTGNLAITYLQNLMSRITPEDQEVLLRVIERDLRCGVSTKLINKTWKKLIPEYPVLLCSKYNEKTKQKIKFPSIFQLKSDGGRINLEFDKGKFISATTRNGNILDFTRFDKVTIPNNEHLIIDGELLWRYPDGKLASRKVSNGYVTKAVRGTITEEEAAGLYVNAWDYIPYDDFLKEKCTIPYSRRLLVVESLITEQNLDCIRLIESEIVNSEAEVREKYQRNLDRGEEGGILKSMDGIWEAKRSGFQLKLKAEDPCDLIVVGYEFGKVGSKFEKVLGALICETSCGKLRVSVGSGFKDDQRTDPEYYMNKIVQVKFNCVIDSESNDTKSLFLPIFEKIREDKTEANSLEELE